MTWCKGFGQQKDHSWALEGDPEFQWNRKPLHSWHRGITGSKSRWCLGYQNQDTGFLGKLGLCREKHTSDKPHPDLGPGPMRQSCQPALPPSLLSFLLQTPQGHLLPLALQHESQTLRGRESRVRVFHRKGQLSLGKKRGTLESSLGEGCPRALTPSPATGQEPSLAELAPIRLPNTDIDLPQSLTPPPGSPTPSPQPSCTPTHPKTAHGPQPAPSRRLCPGTRPSCCLPTAHPPWFPREQAPSQPSPTHSLP
jgi:hypothetical protein